MPRQSKLTDHEHVHRSAKCKGYFMRDWHATARECQNHQVGAVPEVLEPAAED
jgi:hypothetical protein